MSIYTNPAGTPTPPEIPQPVDAGSRVMGKEDFLKLLVTQLGNQDPLNPMDGQQFAAQLAQFSSVEQLVNISEALANQAEMSGLLSQNVNSTVATGLIGKHIEAVSDQVNLKAGENTTLGLELASEAADVSVIIKNQSGQIIRTIEVGSAVAGPLEVIWDGTNMSGVRQTEGAYTVEVKATDANGDPVESVNRVSGQVDRVSFGADGARIWIDQLSVPLGSVVSVAPVE
jgi:flagellar basal-body rod modification protein FlgD